ncbi:DUF4351 domain-containing protein [Duganella sp. BuS-21]|uniref:DUF4351 domain-containing protein n=1 Tax=Duganella sp. BuS-21 TaxID=2943848 RepID=UPI0035A5B6DD
MPNTAQPARYDLPWKAALTHAFHPFMDFYFPDFSAHIDWTQRPRFRDKELAGLVIGAAPNVMVADKLVEVSMRDGGVERILVHIEIQAQRDAALARRVHDYNYHIGKTYGQSVASLVLLADTDPHWRPSHFHQQMLGTARGFSFTIAKLIDFAADTAALEALNNPFAWLTLAHLRTQQAHHDPAMLYAAKLHLTRLLFKHRWKRGRIIVLFNVINWMMALPEPHQRRYWQAVLRLEKEHEMKLLNPLEQMFLEDGIKKGLEIGVERGMEKGMEQGLQKGRREGLEQGLERGLARGRAEGAATLLERLLTQRYGPLSKTVRNRLAKASVEQVESWSDALAAAQTLKQVFATTQPAVKRPKKMPPSLN